MIDDQVTIEINGTPLPARKGAMVIEVADEAGITIPRFCYHKKLSVAANCRMCLVEVEKVHKPVPACATPVMDGMKVWTNSPRAISAQKGTMEFLLINHPLDCPICDQGGECELQDLSMGYGKGVARYSEAKRVVADKNIGPLIATEMTRCIHCTRCVRFGAEIAGVRELGATGRGDHMLIGTYIERSVDSELSGNVIDLCPVGALTAKPSRYKARPWELMQHASVAPHDSVGSNIFLHSRRGEVLRAVPRENEEVNEVWISDRDRFSYEGVNSPERLTRPMLKVDGEWRECDWDDAFEAAVKGVLAARESHGAQALGALASPSATLEELYLFSRLARELGSRNIDHRLRQGDFRDQHLAPVFPWLGQSLEELEQVEAALVIGSNLRKEQPLLNHRLRKAALNGAKVMFVNPLAMEATYPVAASLNVAPAALPAALAGIASALLDGAAAPAGLAGLLEGVSADAEQQAIAAALKAAGSATVLLGGLAVAHPDFSLLRALADFIAEQSGARFGYLSVGGNSVGAWLAGAVPHRTAGGHPDEPAGMDARGMLEQPRQAYLLLNVEPGRDCWNPAQANAAMREAFVTALTPFADEGLMAVADVLLPVATFAETAGTLVNGEGRWQSFAGAVPPPGEARPAWKVLRVLGNLFGLAGFEYLSAEEVRDELHGLCGELSQDNHLASYQVAAPAAAAGLWRVGEVPLYAVDSLVRRAPSLQATADAVEACVALNPAELERLGLSGVEQVKVRQGDAEALLPLHGDARVAAGAAWIPAGVAGSEGLGPLCGPVELERA